MTEGMETMKTYFHVEAWNDRWIAEVVFPGLKGGFFVEAGCADGIRNSSCYFLEKHLGWRGICVEPDPVFYPLAVKQRQTVVNAALGHESRHSVPFHSFDNHYYSGVQDYLENRAQQLASEALAKEDDSTRGLHVSIEVRLMTLAELLDEHHAPKLVHYVALDIEGGERSVLQAFFADAHTHKTQILAFSIEGGNHLADLMKANGYVHVKNPFNLAAPWENYFLHSSMDLDPSVMAS